MARHIELCTGRMCRCAEKYEAKELGPIETIVSAHPGDTVISVEFDVYDFAADTGEVSYQTKRFSITADTFRKVTKIIVEDAQP